VAVHGPIVATAQARRAVGAATPELFRRPFDVGRATQGYTAKCPVFHRVFARRERPYRLSLTRIEPVDLMEWDKLRREGQAVDDPTKHNYMKKLLKLQAEGKLPKVGLHDVDVAHDDWCQVYQGGYCNCDPDITIRKRPWGTPGVN
jgi:hypothetical protein